MSNDLYQTVTNSIIGAIESGVKPWVCPWQQSTLNIMPTNYKTKSVYSGINILILWAAATRAGFSTNLWLTYKQAQELGGQVRKGEKSISCVFFKNLIKNNLDLNTDEKIAHSFMAKSFWLFNIEQIDGIELSIFNETVTTNFESMEKAELLLSRCGVKIQERGDKAFYSRGRDYIVMPERKRFSCAADYYTTVNHELTHWTGHPSRLNRVFGKRFGDDAYAFEELVAELGSAFVNASLGLDGKIEHASYIDHWLQILRKDKKAIFSAAKHAFAAYQFILQK